MKNGLTDNIWWTRKARIQTEKRLLRSAQHTQALLLWYSFFSVGVSVYYLEFNSSSEYAGVAWVVFSVLILCLSGFINGLGFHERASLIKDCYESLNALYQKSKAASVSEEKIAEEYEKLLSVCENHTDIDYHMALCETYLTNSAGKLDREPTKYVWFLVFRSRAKLFCIFSALYLLPALMFYLVEGGHVCTH